MKTLIHSENDELSLQLLGKASELSNQGSSAVAFEEEQSKVLSENGAKTYFSRESNIEGFTTAILEVVSLESPDLILIGSTRHGRELAPRIAAKLGVSYASDCFDVQISDGFFKVKRFTYGGSTIATELIKGNPAVVTIPPRAFRKREGVSEPNKIIELNVKAPSSRVKVIERKSKKTSDAGLESAKIIVSAGRGFKRQEDLRLLEELATEIGAKMSCTRPISADLGWMDQWVGISGKKVAPKLYIACGISGTVQHAAGIRDSQIIVSINNDEAAGIHALSDYSIVGDIYIVLPALTTALRANRSQN